MATTTVVAPFRSCLAIEYYDGPTAGIAFDAGESAVYFALVGWDPEQWTRVFAVCDISGNVAQQVWADFERIDTPRRPLWAPNCGENNQAMMLASEVVATLHKEIRAVQAWYLCESHNLIEGNIRRADLSAAEAQIVAERVDSKSVQTLTGKDLLTEFVQGLRSGHED